MTTNEELKQLMETRGLDTRADARSNRDVAYVARLVEVSPGRVECWLSPEGWKKHKQMHPAFLLMLKEKLKNHSKPIDSM